MKHSSSMATGVMCVVVLAASLRAEEPPKKPQAAKPPWQRLLQGADAKKAEEQDKKLAELLVAGKFAEALKLAEALAELRARVQGAEHWQAVNAKYEVQSTRRVLSASKEDQQSCTRAFALELKGEELANKGRYGEAQKLFEQVLAIRRRILGEENPYTAQTYNNVAFTLGALSKHREAQVNYAKALAIHRKLVGEEHPEIAQDYNNLALNLYAQGKYPEAEEGLRKVLEINRKVHGESHSETARSYNNLAGILNALGKYREAEEGYGKALAIWLKVLGEQDPLTATGYDNLADNLNAQGKYREADQNFRKALVLRLKLLGEEHPQTAASYNNLALNLTDQGKYKEAEEGYGRALVIFRKMLGEEHPSTATCYDNVASNLNAQGRDRKAEEGYRMALAIRLKVRGEEHPDTAISYNNLAIKLSDQGNYLEAGQNYDKALAIYRKLGEETPFTARIYINSAYNLTAQRKYGEAEQSYRKALAICLKVVGEEHTYTADNYGQLAINLNAQGRFREAEESYGKALTICSKVLGEEHPYTAHCYNKLALDLKDQGKYREAQRYFLRAAESFAKARLHVARTGLQRARFTGERSPLPPMAAVLARLGKRDDAWQRFEESRSRGAWDDLSARLRRPQAERDKQAQLDARIDRLQKLIEEVSVAKPTPEQLKQREERLSQLQQAYGELAVFTQQLEQKHGPVTGQVFARGQIQAALPADAALVAWLDIPGNPKAADPDGEHWAILLRPAGTPIWVRLPGTGDKDAWTDADTQLPGRLREALESPRDSWQPLADRLRKQRLEPLSQDLKGIHRLIVLPSTALAGVPIEVIADGYTISYAHSGTMFAHLRRQPAPTGKGLFALADPVFDAPSEKDKQQPLPPGGVLLTMVTPGSNAALAGLKPNDVLLNYGDTDLSRPADFKPEPESNDPDKRVDVTVWREGKKLPRPLRVRPGDLGVVFAQEPAPKAVAEQRRLNRLLASRSGDDGKWDRLSGTRFEVSSLQRLFDNNPSVQVLFDSDASEQHLNELVQRGALGGYRYLHLATHGEVDDVFPLRSAVILSRDQLPDDKERSELLLAGQAIPDGRLTAEEALQHWNLHCDLVTLSACQTALGKYERGEGYVGFAQALILCGARSVCLSLWRVDDTATALLMERFYQNLLGKRDGLKGPMPKAAALAEAKAWLRDLPRAEALKRVESMSKGVARGKRPKPPPLEVTQANKLDPKKPPKPREDRPYAHPYYWAAFVLIGNPE